MELRFTKMHGLGNDFIVAEDLASDIDMSPDAVELLCDRHFGIGADGLILVRPATIPDADFAWWFRNSDGSVAEMCGNGIRCFAKFLADRGLIPHDAESVRVETAVGSLPIALVRDAVGTVCSAIVDMGEPILDPALVPTSLRGSDGTGPALDVPVTTDAGSAHVTCVSMGNPHAIVFVDDVDIAPVHTLGPALEVAPEFPRKTNVEFAQILTRHSLRLRVWERGCGETLACGTGACATVVAANLNGLCDRKVTVELPGGELDIEWVEGGSVLMTGPATTVFTGVFEIPEA